MRKEQKKEKKRRPLYFPLKNDKRKKEKKPADTPTDSDKDKVIYITQWRLFTRTRRNTNDLSCL